MEIGRKIVDGRYTIQRKLGQGAFGAVYLANDNVSDTSVAIKMVPAEVSREESELADLKQNFKLVHELAHPHIATMRTLDYDKQLDKYCLVMEFVEGKNLSVYRKNQTNRKVPVDEAIKICRQLAEAIDYAHHKGILHRDIKPENTILDTLNDVKLLDFGLASQIRSTVMKRSRTIDANAMAGTRPYMAPEQFKGKPVVPASDIWALGIVFCEMITGDLPFYSDDFQVLKASVCEETVDPIAELDKTQNQIVQKVLAKDPRARFAKAVDFAQALEDSIKPKGSKKKWVVLGVLTGALIIGGFLRNMYWQEKARLDQESSLTGIERITRDLFSQMLNNKAAYFRAGLGILGSFPGCNEEVYASAYTALINSANRHEWKLLVRNDLQAVLDDKKVVSGYRQESLATALSEVEESQAVIVGNCIKDKLYLRVIDTNSQGLAAAMGSWKDDAAERKQLEIRLAEEKRKQAQAEARQEEAAQALARQKEKAQKRRAQQAKETAERERLREEARLAELKRKQAEARLAQMQKEMTDAKKAAEAKALTEEREKARQARMEAERQRQREEATRNAKHSLTIKTTPGNARIRILNIGPRYQDGLKLKPDRYDIEVSKEGYKRHREWIELEARDMVHLVDLEKIEKKPDYENSYSLGGGSHSAGDTWTDSVTGMEFMWVPKGCFQMGSNSGQDDEKPIHEICIDGVWMGKYEITVGQFTKFKNEMGYSSEPSNEWKCKGTAKVDGFSQTSEHPVACVTWKDVKAFAEWLSRKSGKNYRMPTEAEWEYACRSGGKDQKYCGGNNLDGLGWYSANANGKTHAVGRKQKNGLGLYDMSGNVWEWVNDWYEEGYYAKSPKRNPKGPASASARVNRGGGWDYVAGLARSAYRAGNVPDSRVNNLGARLVRQP